MTTTLQVTTETFDKLTVGKVYRFDGRKGRVIAKTTDGGQLASGISSYRPMVTVRWIEQVNPNPERTPTMFRVHFTNHGYFSQRDFATVEAAADFARHTTFDCGIYSDAGGTLTLVASYSYFGGLRHR